MTINDFDHIYLINLKKRPDRLARSLKECNQVGIVFERFEAWDADLRETNWVRDSHMEKYFAWNKYSAALLETTIALMEDAKAKKYENILVLEDDVKFCENFAEELALVSPPEHAWEFLYLGASHFRKPVIYDSHLFRLRFSLCCQAYAINRTVYDAYLQKLEKRNMPIDWVVAQGFQHNGNSYSCRKPLATQYANFSNIRQHVIDYHKFFFPDTLSRSISS